MEQLEIIVDADTDKAIANIMALVNALHAAEDAAHDLGDAGDDLQESLGKAGESASKVAEQADKAAEGLEQFQRATEEATDASEDAAQQFSEQAEQTKAAGQSAADATPQFESAAEQLDAMAGGARDTADALQAVSEAAPDAAAAMGDVATDTDDAATASGSYATRASGMIVAYEVIEKIKKALDDLIERYKQVLEAQQQLTEKFLTDQQAVDRLVPNLNLTGPTAYQQAMELRNQVITAQPVSNETANSALSISYAARHDPKSKEGMAFTNELAINMARMGLSEDSANDIVKMLPQLGLNSAEGLKTAFGKLQQLYIASQSTHPSEWLSGLITGVMPQIPKDVDPNYAMAVYSALVRVAPTEQAAADATKMVFAFAQGTNEKTKTYFARQAAALGDTNVAAVTDQDVAGSMAGDGTATDLKSQLKLDQQELSERRRRPLSADQSQRLQNDIAKIQSHLQALRDKAREKIQAEREQAAYNAVGLQARMGIVAQVMHGLQTAADFNTFNEATGGRLQRTDAARLFGEAGTQAEIAADEAKAKGATGTSIDPLNQTYRESPTAAQQQATNAATVIEDSAAASPGVQYAQQLLTVAKATFEAKSSAFVYAPDTAVAALKMIGQNTDVNLNDEVAAKLVSDITDFMHAAPTPAMRLAAADLKQRLDTQEAHWSAIRLVPGSQAARALDLNKLAVELGAMKKAAFDFLKANPAGRPATAEDAYNALDLAVNAAPAGASDADVESAARGELGVLNDPSGAAMNAVISSAGGMSHFRSAATARSKFEQMQGTWFGSQFSYDRAERAADEADNFRSATIMGAQQHLPAHGDTDSPTPGHSTSAASHVPPTASAPVPSTQPSSDGGHADATNTYHEEIHYHFGNAFFGASTDGETPPGRLEGWG